MTTKHPYDQSLLKTIWYYLSWPFVRPKVSADSIEKVEFPFFRHTDKINLKDAWIVYGDTTYNSENDKDNDNPTIEPRRQTEEEICRINNEFFRWPKVNGINIGYGAPLSTNKSFQKNHWILVGGATRDINWDKKDKER